MYLGFDYQIIWQFSLWFSWHLLVHFPHFCQVSHLFGQAVNFAADTQDFEPVSLSKDGWHPEWPMMKEPMIVPLVRDSEVLLVARSSVNCNRTPSFIKFLLSKPEGRRPKRLHKNNQASVFLAQFMWNKPFLSMFLQSQTLSSLFFVSVNHGAANDPRFRGRYREKWERSGIVLTTRSVAHKLLVFSLPPSSVPARMTCGCSHVTTKTRHDFKASHGGSPDR